MYFQNKQLPLVAALVFSLPFAFADEGMWTFNDFPSAKVDQIYNFAPDQAWLDHLRLASVRIPGGCSGAVVSSQGLVMTNHHCARECIENISGLTKKDYIRDGFLAKSDADEPHCPGVEMNQLIEITNVTERVAFATHGASAESFGDVQKSTFAAIEKECASSDEFRCEVVTLYHGGRYDLYKYRRFQDVRLVFAPEYRIAFFGGDTDNFNFPRYDLDVAMLRIYGKDGKPLADVEHLAWSVGNVRDGDLVFVSGNPGGTSRGLTVAELDDERNRRLPARTARLADMRQMLKEFQQRGPEQNHQAGALLVGIENALKVYTGRNDALADKDFYAQLAKHEDDFRARVVSDSTLAKQYGGTWDAIGALVAKGRSARVEYNALENGFVGTSLFTMARSILRMTDELGKPNGERLREFADARIPQMRRNILANRPINDEFEVAMLTFALVKIREDLGSTHPVIQRVFGKRSAAEIAIAAVTGSKLKDLGTDANGNALGGYRKQLLDGGKAAVDASHDPMIELARAFDPDARAIRRLYETTIDGPIKRQEELLAKARFMVYGNATYPDATFTPRLSYGTVKGWVESGKPVKPFTTIAGAYAHATGSDPFALPDSWIGARDRLDPVTPFDLVATNDVIGGNSGSPMVNRKGEVVGLVFDGNIHSLGGEYGYDAALNRTVAVDSAILIEAMDKVYGANRIVRELTGSPKAPSAR